MDQIEFRAEVRQLLNILVNSLYTDKEIFLRELISNGSDALNRVQFEMLTNRDVLDEDAELAIYLEADEEAGVLTIRDSGIGMTREELDQNLGTIAQSGARNFLEAMAQAGAKGEKIADDLIGHFGVGFYSVFMVAEEVTIATRSYRREAEAATWSSSGETYTLGPSDKTSRGMEVRVKLKEEAREFARPQRIREIVKTHSDFVAFPIYLKEKTEFVQVNQQKAIWRQSPREVGEDEYRAFYRQFTLDFGDPLLRVHVSTDAPIQLYALLFIPSRRDYRAFGKDDYGLWLYSRKVLVQEDFKELLPKYLRFVEGVVDSEDIPLNVSRETVQTTPLLGKVQNMLVRRLYGELHNLAKEKPEVYRTFWDGFGGFLKEGLATDPGVRDEFKALLRFQSSKSRELTSLSEYVERMRPDQKEIYYILGDDYEAISRSPHMDFFKKHDIEVLYLTDQMDSFMLIGLNDYDGRPLKNVDDADLKLPQVEQAQKEESIPTGEFEALVDRFKEALGDRVEDVRESRVLTDSPCRLVNPPGAPGTGLQRVQRLLDKDYQIPRKILEINRHNRLMQNLAARLSAGPGDVLVNLIIEQLFESALVVEGLHPNPADMIPRIQQLMEAASGLGLRDD